MIDRYTHTPQRTNTLQGVSILEMIVGAWMIVSALVFDGLGDGRFLLAFGGVIVGAIGVFQYLRASRHVAPLTPLAIALVAIGLWVAMTPFIITLSAWAAFNHVLVGIALIALAVWEILEGRMLAPRRIA